MGRLHHHHNCWKCPVIGAEDIPGEEFFEFRRSGIRLNITRAKELVQQGSHEIVEFQPTEIWDDWLFGTLTGCQLVKNHDKHIPDVALEQPGIIAMIPDAGRWLIDGHHRALACMTRKKVYRAYVLTEEEFAQIRV